MTRGRPAASPTPVAAVALAAAAAIGLSIGCAGSRRVGASPAEPAPSIVSAAPPAAAPAAAPAVVPGESTAPGPAIPPAEAAATLPEPSVSIEEALRAAVVDIARHAERRREFGRAVARISAELGVPIGEAQAVREMPCGGWSGPDCSNLTLGLEIARVCAPVVASFHRKRTAEIAAVMAQAVSVHAVWHDAYGYVRRVKKKGPGYTYAGCLFSRCDPDDQKNGQVDGVLYQVGRLLGTLAGPACGPECKLVDP
jgi:hypothetical protein